MAIKTGTRGNDQLAGSRFDDVILGLAGNDTLSGLGGRDEIVGGVGLDLLHGGDGDDALFGQAGNDRLFDGAGGDLLDGGDGDDRLDGTAADPDPHGPPDTLYGGAGDDLLLGDNQDMLDGGSGDDRLTGGATLHGGDGDDTIGTDSASAAYGGAGDDTLIGSRSYECYLDGGAGDDRIVLREGLVNVSWAPGEGRDFITAGPGLVDLIATSSRDGHVLRVAADGAQTVIATDDPADGEIRALTPVSIITIDMLDVPDQRVEIGALESIAPNVVVSVSGGARHDQVDARRADTAIFADGQTGNDTIQGGRGNDELYGQEGNDRLIGGAGDDTLEGFFGFDRLEGGTGNDVLIFRDSEDVLRSGSGRDVYEAYPEPGLTVPLTDFEPGRDTLQVNHHVDELSGRELRRIDTNHNGILDDADGPVSVRGGSTTVDFGAFDRGIIIFVGHTGLDARQTLSFWVDSD